VTDAIETALNQVGGMSSPDAQCVAFLITLCLATEIGRPMCSLALSSERQTERQKGRKTERQEGSKTERQKGRKAERQEGRKTERQKDRKAERQKDRKAGRQKDRKAERQKDRYSSAYGLEF
jgi:hypothetical protein